ncbi:Mss4-like protein [Pyrenochaeta sp. MPI-SDFR-AT-0127]|nr:Mss4-like protein [Pyrenochaeta sp. MPI-SDFR-AT-0127]
MAASVRDSDKSASYFPLAGLAKDGYYKPEENEATATCFCGAVQLAFVSPLSLTLCCLASLPVERRAIQPIEGPGLIETFVCNCTDCRKITASMFASNFTIDDKYLKHLRGQENLKTFGQDTTIASSSKMTNYFCQTCGTLMYRVGAAFPGCSILRLGTVDDFNLVEKQLKPQREQFIKDRVNWFTGVVGEEVKQFEGMLPS